MNLCRLCAESKRPDEIIGQISDTTLNIEEMLIACCRWNSNTEIEREKLPKNVCTSCYQILLMSWNFCESVQRVQIELSSKFLDIKLQIVENGPSQIEESSQLLDVKIKVEELENNESTHILPSSSIANFMEFEASSPMLFKEELTNAECQLAFDDSESDNASESSFSVQTNYMDENRSNDHKEDNRPVINIPLSERCKSPVQTKRLSAKKIKNPQSKPMLKNKFQLRIPKNLYMESFQQTDYNGDGTIKLEAIQRLKLDNWTSLQHQCYVCKEKLTSHIELRDHLKNMHPDQPIRHICSFCNGKEFKCFSSLRRHVTSYHRKHFTLCCHLCNQFFWDKERKKYHGCQKWGFHLLEPPTLRIPTRIRYLCKICNFSSLDSGNICNHIRKKHGIVSKELKQHYRKEMQNVN